MFPTFLSLFLLFIMLSSILLLLCFIFLFPCLTFSRTLTFSTLPLYFSNFTGFLLLRPPSIPFAFHILA